MNGKDYTSTNKDKLPFFREPVFKLHSRLIDIPQLPFFREFPKTKRLIEIDVRRFFKEVRAA